MKTATVGTIVYSFFEDYLKCQKGLRPATVRSYRDSIRLFLNFVAGDVHRNLSRLNLEHLTAERVRRFLNSLERERHNHVRTRNLRLSALRTFFEFVARQSPEMLGEAEQVAATPTKRCPPPETFYLEREEIQALFDGLPREGRCALRDRALLLFLYNTGARVQEVAELQFENFELERPARVRLHGKGDKWRVCPLWDETASLIEQLAKRHPGRDGAGRPVFLSQSGRALTRYGIYKMVRRHARVHIEAHRQHHIFPHVLRHTAAVHLLESGVDVNVIRAWLGHVNLETTNRYAEITTPMKEAALRHCEPPVASATQSSRSQAWKDDKTLLAWLESL